MSDDHGLIQPNAQHQYTVTPADLPLSCPMPDMYLWNSHPARISRHRIGGLGEVRLLRGGVHACEPSDSRHIAAPTKLERSRVSS